MPPFLSDDSDTRQDLASYYNEVTRMDYYIGQVVDELRKDNLLDNTAANITSSPESFHMSCVIRIFGNEFNQLNIIQP